MEKHSTLGQQVADWHHWRVPYTGNKCQETLICPSIHQMRECIPLWLSSGNTKCIALPKGIFTSFLHVTFPAKTSKHFGFSFLYFGDSWFCLLSWELLLLCLPHSYSFFFLFCCMETLCCTSVSIFLALLFLAYLFMFLCFICLCTALRVSWETVVPSICTYKWNRQWFRNEIGFTKRFS